SEPFFAMEFLEGGTLSARLGGVPQPPREAARLLQTLAEAVEHAHCLGIIHRDLKPDNVLLTADGIPQITDLGMARQLADELRQTEFGRQLGTPSYMAPEQASGRSHEAGPAADVYALGAILYECLTGRPPFRGTTAAETLEQVRSQEP